MPQLADIFPSPTCSLVGLPFTAFERTDDAAPPLFLGAVRQQAAAATKAQVDTLIIGGSTDEFPSLTIAERVAVAVAWRRELPKGTGAKLLLHAGGDSIAEARQLVALAAELRYDGVLITAPSKFMASSLQEHIACLSAALAPLASSTPVLYYHVRRSPAPTRPLAACLTPAASGSIPTWSATALTSPSSASRCARCPRSWASS